MNEVFIRLHVGPSPKIVFLSDEGESELSLAASFDPHKFLEWAAFVYRTAGYKVRTGTVYEKVGGLS